LRPAPACNVAAYVVEGNAKIMTPAAVLSVSIPVDVLSERRMQVIARCGVREYEPRAHFGII